MMVKGNPRKQLCSRPREQPAQIIAGRQMAPRGIKNNNNNNKMEKVIDVLYRQSGVFPLFWRFQGRIVLTRKSGNRKGKKSPMTSNKTGQHKYFI